MIITVIYTIFAILGLSFLIFIHELGHYWMAKRVGMRVEKFSIGFGRPIVSWDRNGCIWQIGWLPFGGFVKIAGMNGEEEGKDPYSIPDGFFGKSPWDRIKVAFAGPFVNLLFAGVLFAMLWFMGGREKNFTEFTNVIGWVDTKSELFALGVRPGDEILSYDQNHYDGQSDHIYAPLVATDTIEVTGNKIDQKTGEKTPFSHEVRLYSHPRVFDKGIETAGILESARYIIYDKLPNGIENPLPQGSPMADSGLKYGDRVLWVDGEIINSKSQLTDVLNDGRALLTIKRGNKTFLRRVPRVKAQELRPDPEFREELIDWQYEAGVNNRRFRDLYAIPYNLTANAVVQNQLRFVDPESEEEAFPKNPFSDRDLPLQPGDKIVAVQGVPINYSFDLIKELQDKKVHVIVQRDPVAIELASWDEVDATYNQRVDLDNLARIAASIGSGREVTKLGNLYMLKPIQPIAQAELVLDPEQKAWRATQLEERRKQLEQIEDPEERAFMIRRFEKEQKELILGIPMIQDRRITYNPKPLELFSNNTKQIGRTLYAMLTGSLSPKYITGPVGIVRVVQGTSMVSLIEALFWLGAISLNLGFLNLLPIPILDGGTIVFSIVEMVSGRKMKPKTLERIIVVFAVLLITFFLFITYHDILRIFG